MRGDLFTTEAVAAGYAAARPAVHPQVLDQVVERLGWVHPVERALDVGCGAGLSTLPLLARARHCLAVDPSPAMVRQARSIVSEAHVAIARAEALPLATASVDLITAAGSLDFTDLDRAAGEVVRVLTPGGHLVVYDFSSGRRLRTGPDLAAWFGGLLDRWPVPSATATPPSAAAFAAAGLDRTDAWAFEVDVAMTRDAYLAYLLTESNVTAAVRHGTPVGEIEQWLTATIPWEGDDASAAVVFEGYVLVSSRR